MSTQLDTREEVVTGLSTIEGIDLDAEVMCEGLHPDAEHDAPADLIVMGCSRKTCPVCISCWTDGARYLGWCEMNDRPEHRDEHFTIVEHLR